MFLPLVRMRVPEQKRSVIRNIKIVFTSVTYLCYTFLQKGFKEKKIKYGVTEIKRGKTRGNETRRAT